MIAGIIMALIGTNTHMIMVNNIVMMLIKAMTITNLRILTVGREGH